MIEIRAACSPGEIRAAAIQDGFLLDYAIHRPDTPCNVGDRLQARILAHLPALAGAFAALPNGIEGFLPDSQAPLNLTAGQSLTVVVTRAAQSGKGPRLSAQTPQAPPGAPAPPHPWSRRHPAPPRPPPPTPPSSSMTPPPPSPTPPPSSPKPGTTTSTPKSKPSPKPPSPSPAASAPPSTPHPPSPPSTSTPRQLPPPAPPSKRAQREANRAALPALARAIRLRNLSGAIVVDLAGMTARTRAALAPDLTAALAPDPLHPKFLGFTALGLGEILRPRIHPPLHELLQGPQAEALNALRHLQAQASASPAIQLQLQASPAITQALHQSPTARADLARRTTHPLIITTNPNLPPPPLDSGASPPCLTRNAPSAATPKAFHVSAPSAPPAAPP